MLEDASSGVLGELGEEELQAVARSAWPKPQAAWGFDAADKAGPEIATLAVLEGDAADHEERVLASDLTERGSCDAESRCEQDSRPVPA